MGFYTQLCGSVYNLLYCRTNEEPKGVTLLSFNEIFVLLWCNVQIFDSALLVNTTEQISVANILWTTYGVFKSRIIAMNHSSHSSLSGEWVCKNSLGTKMGLLLDATIFFSFESAWLYKSHCKRKKYYKEHIFITISKDNNYWLGSLTQNLLVYITYCVHFNDMGFNVYSENSYRNSAINTSLKNQCN